MTPTHAIYAAAYSIRVRSAVMLQRDCAAMLKQAVATGDQQLLRDVSALDDLRRKIAQRSEVVMLANEPVRRLNDG